MQRLLFAALLSSGPGAYAQTFGNGLAGVPICGSSHPPTVIINYTIPSGSSHAVLHHFWTTGQGQLIDRIIIEYYLDGEATPSISFQPSMMCGLQFPEFIAHDYEYSAGGLCGKTAPVGGYSNIFPIPFYKSAVVTARVNPSDGPGVCLGGYLSVRGTLNLPLVVPGSGRPLPFGTRLILQANPPQLWQPLQFVPVASLPKGMRGEVFMVSWAVEAQPEGGAASGGGYIEGCWNFYSNANETYPGLVVGTGVEDYFDSGYYFGADSGDALGILFANALSGLTFFQRQDPYERVSAYRFHNTDPLVMADGGLLTWQVGCEGHAGASKCGNPFPPNLPLLPASYLPHRNPLNSSRATSPVNVTTYAWIYTYPGPYACVNTSGQPQCVDTGSNSSGSSWDGEGCCTTPTPHPTPPPGPPSPSPAPSPIPGPPTKVGCASGFCYAWCDNDNVHGCAVPGWASGGVDLRAPATGKPCGGPLGPCTSSLADACAEGWGVCLASVGSDPTAIDRFRSNFSSGECASGGGAFVAAMSHSNPKFESLPPNPCEWMGGEVHTFSAYFIIRHTMQAPTYVSINTSPPHAHFFPLSHHFSGPPAPVETDNGCAADGWGAEPVCCGSNCAVPSCPNSVWEGSTRIHINTGDGCGSFKPGVVDGVMCCRL